MAIEKVTEYFKRFHTVFPACGSSAPDAEPPEYDHIYFLDYTSKRSRLVYHRTRRTMIWN